MKRPAAFTTGLPNNTKENTRSQLLAIQPYRRTKKRARCVFPVDVWLTIGLLRGINTRKGTKQMTRKAPMTAQEARENIAEMRANTKPAAMKRLVEIALGPLGNLTDEARAVYQSAI